MVVASLSAFLLINYTVFYLLEYEGVPIRELINFWAYLDLDIRTTSLSIGIGSIEIDSTSELGLAGYIYAALQLVGFGLGGYFMFLFLMGNPYCNDCSRYRKRVFRQDRYTSDGDVLVGNVKAVAALFDERKYKDAGELHAVAMGNENPSKASHLRTRIDIHSCTACGTALLVFTTSKAKGHGWDAIADLSFSVLTEQTPDLHSGA